MVRSLERVAEVAGVGAGAVDLSGVPATRLLALARYGVTAKAAALRDLAESRRTATLVAALQSLVRWCMTGPSSTRRQSHAGA
jgi:hypothetical protein